MTLSKRNLRPLLPLLTLSATLACAKQGVGTGADWDTASPRAMSASPDKSAADADDLAPAEQIAPGAPAPALAEMEMEEAPAVASAPAPERKIARRSRGGRAMKKGKATGYGNGSGALQLQGGLAPAPPPADTRAERYPTFEENGFVAVADDPRSTFSIDVDTASYANVRRYLTQGSLPPPDAVRVEEMINYFSYDYPAPKGDAPFSVVTEVGPAPWDAAHRLVHIGIQGKKVDMDRAPARNLVFLLDVSGSMSSPDKLPLLKRSLAMMVDQLRPQDRVSIVVYAGASGVVLEPTSDRAAILAALDRLQAGGSTAGAAGIELAYQMARRSFIRGGINRVILATDGDFNVGPSSQGELKRMIERERRAGVFLSVLGFGTGNLQDRTMQTLAQHGNGNHAYIDSLQEARKVLVEEAGGTLVTIAKDVKIQVEFNPLQVAAYRLIGYETRALAHRDFDDDRKDAGEIGAGHTVTALYEIVPAGQPIPEAQAGALKYQRPLAPTQAARADELLTLRLRYKHPRGARSRLMELPVRDQERGLRATSDDFRFSAAVAEFGMKLRGSRYAKSVRWRDVARLAEGARGADLAGRRGEFLALVERAARL